MKFRLPDFKNSHCRIFTACGHVLGAKPKLGQGWFGTEPLIARYVSEQGGALLRLGAAGGSQQHVHIDCALRSAFPKGNVPKATHKKSEVFEVLSQAAGAELRVGVLASFVFPIKRLPEGGLIRTVSEMKIGGDVSIALSGGKFRVSGAPVRELRWEVFEEQQAVRVETRAEKETILNPGYLAELFSWINDLFMLFALRRLGDATG